MHWVAEVISLLGIYNQTQFWNSHDVLSPTPFLPILAWSSCGLATKLNFVFHFPKEVHYLCSNRITVLLCIIITMVMSNKNDDGFNFCLFSNFSEEMGYFLTMVILNKKLWWVLTYINSHSLTHMHASTHTHTPSMSVHHYQFKLCCSDVLFGHGL